MARSHKRSASPEGKLEMARKLNLGDSRPVLCLGLTQETLGHASEAAAYYEEAIRLEEAAGKPIPS